jgi:hypothetical protein
LRAIERICGWLEKFKLANEPYIRAVDCSALGNFRAKWIPVRVKKTRQNKD